MAKIAILLFPAFLIFSTCFCYSENADKQIINNLIDSIEQNFYTNSLKGRNFVLELEKEAERQKDTHYQAIAKAKMVEYYYPQFDNDSIVAAAETAETFARQHQEYRLMFAVQQTIIQRYVNQGMFILGLSKARQMHDEASKLNDNSNMARAAATLANIYKHKDEFEECCKYLHESLQLLRLTDNGATSALTLENYRELAFMGLKLERYEETILYADSMYICLDLRNKEKQSNDSESTFIAEYLLTQANINLNRQEEAKKHIEKAKELYNESYPLSFRFLLDQMYINYYMQRKGYQQAYVYNERMLQLVREYKLHSALPDILIEKAELLAHLNRHGESVLAYAEAIDRLKENNRSEHALQLNELRIFYDLNKVEQQAREDRLQLEFTQRIVVAISIIALLFVVIAIIVYHNSRRINFKNKKLVAQLQEQDALAKKNRQLEEQVRTLQPINEESQEDIHQHLQELFEQLMNEEKLYTNINLTRKDIQYRLGISERGLRALINYCYGQTYSIYIAQKRVQHARELLSTPDNGETIENIGYESGFGSRSTFYRQFREFYGLTPDEYRKSLSSLQE